jgi:hypothetical protein
MIFHGLLGKRQDYTLNQATTASFSVLSSLLLTDKPVIRCYILSVVENIILYSRKREKSINQTSKALDVKLDAHKYFSS